MATNQTFSQVATSDSKAKTIKIVLNLSTSVIYSQPWAGAQALIRQLCQDYNKGAEDHLEHQQRILLGLIYDRFKEFDDGDDAKFFHQSGALFLGRLPGTVLIQKPLYDAWCDLLALYIGQQSITISIPLLTQVDAESFSLFRGLRKRLGERFGLRVGPDDIPPDFDTLVERCNFALITQELQALKVVNGSFVKLLSINDDEVAWSQLDSDQARYDFDNDQTLFGAFQEAFNAFSFTSALSMGLTFLERFPESDCITEVQTFVGLAARQWMSRLQDQNSTDLQALMETQWQAALKQAQKPTSLVLLLQHLSILKARVLGDIEGAMDLAQQSLDLCHAGDIQPDLVAYYKAWALNGRAYAYLRLQQFSEAILDCEQGYDLLKKNENHLDIPQSQLDISKMFLLRNLTRLTGITGPLQQAQYWYQELDELVDFALSQNQPIISQVDQLLIWWQTQVDQDNLATATDYLNTKLHKAEQNLDVGYEALCSFYLANLYFQLNKGDLASKHYRRTREIWQGISADADNLLTINLNCAVAAFRAGELDQAEIEFNNLLQGDLGVDSDSRAELSGALAMVTAKNGDILAAKRLANEAINLANINGEVDVLIRTHRSVGETYLFLDDTASATQYFTDVLSYIYPSQETLTKAGIPTEDIFGILVGLASCQVATDQNLYDALRLVPESLEDSNAWWDLSTLIPSITTLSKRSPYILQSEQYREPLRALVRAGTQLDNNATDIIALKQLLL
ncbi:MAG: tetratricopeptide repeat protein [Chloroflexota bacterium]